MMFCLCEGVRSSGTADIDSSELPCECWELNMDPLEKQHLNHSAALKCVYFIMELL